MSPAPRRPAARLACRAIAMFLLIGSLTSVAAGDDPDTIAVTPPEPSIATGPPASLFSGRDGTWWPVPKLSLAATALSFDPNSVRSALPGLLADLGSRQTHTIVFDSARRRFIAFGGALQPDGIIYNDVWERALGATGAWTPMSVAGTPPAARYLHSAIYDPIGDRMIVFGGRSSGLLGDLWELDFSGSPEWHPILPGGTPPSARSGHTASYDPTHHRMVVFGGETPFPSNEVWFLDLDTAPPTWQLVAPAGTPPAGREFHTAIVDAAHDRLVIHGGVGATYYNELWTLSLGGTPTWVQRFATGLGPAEMVGGQAGYDAPGNRLVMLAGHYFLSYTSAIWGLDLSTFVWNVISTPDTPPSGRAFMGFAMDPVSRTGVLSGGVVGSNPSLGDTWQLTVGTNARWTRFVPDPPPPPPPPPPPAAGPNRYAAAGVFDIASGRYFLLGGAAYPVPGMYDPVPHNDILELKIGSDSTWVRETSIPAESLFSARYGHSAILDPGRGRILVFGGYDGAHFLNDVWEVRLSPTLACHPLPDVAGAPPIVRDFHTAIYDPVRDRMIIFGGNNSNGFRQDVWALNLAGPPTWTQIFPSGPAPSPRLTARAVYDANGDRMLVFGGFGPTSSNELWALSLGPTPAWTLLSPAGSAPVARHSHGFVLDPTLQRAILFGGFVPETLTPLADLWELTLDGPLEWHQLTPSGVLPSARYGQLTLLDPVEDRMLVSGGYRDGKTLNDVWRLQWSPDSPTATTTGWISSEVHPDRVELRWEVVAPAGTIARIERRGTDEVWRSIERRSLDGSRLLRFVDREVTPRSRYGYRVVLDEGGRVTTSTETWIEIPGVDGFALQGFSPNPGSLEARVRFTLADSRPATIDLIDVGGRRVARKVLDHPVAGTTTLELAPEGTIVPGLYFIRLTQGDQAIVRRGTIMR